MTGALQGPWEDLCPGLPGHSRGTEPEGSLRLCDDYAAFKAAHTARCSGDRRSSESLRWP